MAQNEHHFLLVTYPAQGHINPTIEFAKRLICLDVKVTFTTTVSAYRKMSKYAVIQESLNFVTFSDGFDDGFNSNSDDGLLLLTNMRNGGTQSLKETILSSSQSGMPVTCMVYTLLLPWAGEVARGLNVPSTLLWIQPASVFRIYYYYFNGYDKVIGEDCNEPSWSIQLPGLPLLKSRDIPSFCLPSNPYSSVLPLFKEEIDMQKSKDKPTILVNSFDAFEEEALKEIDGKLKMVVVGPLIPTDKSSRGDLFETSKDYLEWMNTKPEGSIVYLSFGSILEFSKIQKEAMALGLLESGRPFVWVIRDGETGQELSCMEKLEQLGQGRSQDFPSLVAQNKYPLRPVARSVKVQLLDRSPMVFYPSRRRSTGSTCYHNLVHGSASELGLIVSWCSQLEVLSHPSLGCFVTHCGWNSTLESVVCGVPVVAFPHWTDQMTNAKLIEDVWGTGVRVTTNEEGVVESEEIKRCVELVMGDHENGVAMRKNAKKWKDLAREAMKEGGSSLMNLKCFVEAVDGSLI